jgi:hypothetical protein
MNILQSNEVQEWEESGTDVQSHFEINDMNGLNWAFRKLAAYKAKETEISKLAQAERDRINFWEAEQKQSIQRDMDYFELIIQAYHMKQLQADPKAKTLSTPYGKSKSRVTKAQPDKADEEVLLQYIKANQMQEFIKETVKWGDLKKTLQVVEIGESQVVVDGDGQQVPGAIVKPASIMYSVEVD